MEHFENAGLSPAIEAAGFQKKFGAIFKMGNQQCDFNFSEQYTKGCDWAWQVPRDTFDKTLADEVEKMGIPIHYESSVIDVKFKDSNSTTTVQSCDGDTYQIEAKYIVDCSGYGRVLPRLLDLDVPSDFPERAAIFTQVDDIYRPDDLESNRITVIAHTPDFWVWIIPFSNGKTSIGFVGKTEDINKNIGSLTDKFRYFLREIEQIPKRFHEANFQFDPKQITGYSKAVKQLYGPGYVLTGNATEFLDPVFSSGILFATESSTRASSLVCKELQGEKQDWEKLYSTPLLTGVEIFRTYVQAWYDGRLQTIFFSGEVEPSIKNKICSVLAGYVWDKSNPFVRNHKRSISNLSALLKKKYPLLDNMEIYSFNTSKDFTNSFPCSSTTIN